MKACVMLPDMTWPHPAHGEELGWRLRYHPECLTREDQLTLASIVSAYAELIRKPVKRRNEVISQIREAIDAHSD